MENPIKMDDSGVSLFLETPISIYTVCVCMLAVVVAVLIAYDYDCARTL